jgi:hypothetical protein
MALVVAPVIPLFILLMGMAEHPWNVISQIPHTFQSVGFAFGMGYMYLAELVIALPLHVWMRSYKVTSSRAYAAAGALTGAVAIVTLSLLSGSLRYMPLFLFSIVAGFVGGVIFWSIAVRAPQTHVSF